MNYALRQFASLLYRCYRQTVLRRFRRTANFSLAHITLLPAAGISKNARRAASYMRCGLLYYQVSACVVADACVWALFSFRRRREPFNAR